ncbi:MAG: TolC family protein [Saprospirales bacterium]|nr:MAG: TolC family protein [Saprospirales bacterium]
MNLNKSLIFLITSLCFSGLVFGQEVWTLQECVQHAVQNNITIKNSLLNEEMAKIDLQQARHNQYPFVNANTNFGNNFGRTIDPATNQFRSQTLTFNSWSVNFGMPIFNGFAIKNRIQQAEYQLESRQFDTQQTLDDIQLNVVTFYLNVLFAEDNLENALNQLEISTRQLDRVNSLIRAGSLPASDRYDLQVQVAIDEERVIQAQNAVDQSLIQLKNLLLLDPEKEIVLDRPELEVPESESLLNIAFPTLYNRALENQAMIQSSDRQIKASVMGEKIAASGLWPTLSIGGSFSTNYSNRAQRLSGTELDFADLPATINGVPVIISLPNPVPVFEDHPYFSQLESNFGYGIGISLSIPIYNNYSNQLNLQRAKLNTIMAQNADEQIRQNLRTNISQARADAKAASQAYRAAERSLEASEVALRNAERKLEVGTATTFDLINSQNLLINSRNNLLQAKYDYIFKLKVIDYYLGNPIVLD